MSAKRMVNLSTGRVLAERLEVAKGAVSRLVGLLARRRFEDDEGLVIPRCGAIHTWFMRFPIDVVFLRGGRVIRVVEALPPWRLIAALRSDAVVELPAGTMARNRVAVGDVLKIEESP